MPTPRSAIGRQRKVGLKNRKKLARVALFPKLDAQLIAG
jgi:hypothetical protein